MLMLLWPLLMVNWFNLMRNNIFVQNNRTTILPGDTRLTTSELPDVSVKLEAWRLKMLLPNFHFLQFDMVLEL